MICKINELRKKQKKGVKRFGLGEKRFLYLHPAREGVLTNNDWLKRDENFLKKKFQKVLVIKKKGLLLHPLTQRATLEVEANK